MANTNTLLKQQKYINLRKHLTSLLYTRCKWSLLTSKYLGITTAVLIMVYVSSQLIFTISMASVQKTRFVWFQYPGNQF